jgi:adenine-specific DNA-methyltransferase
VLDVFAGSGTVGHAVIQMNQNDDGNRRFILMEADNRTFASMSDRLKKVSCSENWNNGRCGDLSGPGLFMRVQTLEQYDDTLENLDTSNNVTPLELPLEDPAHRLRYRLDRESQRIFCDIEHFDSPFDYRLKLATPGNGQPPQEVDLVESLIYLLGLDVHRLYREDQGVVITGADRRDRSVAVFFRHAQCDNSAAWVQAKLAEHDTERVLTNHPASLTFDGSHRFEAIETVFASQFGGR